MKERLEKRLKELEAEYERGQQMLFGVETQHRSIMDALLRISGAMRVLKEELTNEAQTASNKIEQAEHLEVVS